MVSKLRYQEAPIPLDEKERLRSLKELKVLDTLPEERFDRITKLATTLFNVPISTITLVDSNREWFKSCQGLSQREGDRAISFCGHALLSENIFVIPDTKKDPRFAGNPMVVGKPYIRFYAAAPLFSADGRRIGVLCVKDRRPRHFTKRKIELLKNLGAWAELELNAHELSRALEARKKVEMRMLELNEALRLLNKIMRHDILNNLTLIQGGMQLYVAGKWGNEQLKNIFAAINQSVDLINQMKNLESAVSTGTSLRKYKLRNILAEVINNFPLLTIRVRGRGTILADQAVVPVLENIISNAQVHGKSKRVDVRIRESLEKVQIKIADYGKGIPHSMRDKVFEEGVTHDKSSHGGLGLYIVKKTIERYGGEIAVEDNKPKGAVFTITLPRVI